jgi:hypothetical protein
MVPQDSTRPALVLALLGVILAVAVFRPQIPPIKPVQSTRQPVQTGESTRTPGLSKGVTPEPEEQAVLEEELDPLKHELDRREMELDDLQAALDNRELGPDSREPW